MPYTQKQKNFFGAIAGGANTKEGPSKEDAKKMLTESKGMPTKPPVDKEDKETPADEKKESPKKQAEEKKEGTEKPQPKSKGEETVDKYSKTLKKGKKWPEESKKKTASFLDKEYK